MSHRDRMTPDRWLYDMAAMLRPWLRANGLPPVPDTFQFRCAHDGGRQAFGRTRYAPPTINVTWHIDDPLTVTHVLMHEMVHAALGPGTGHGKLFKTHCDAIGLGPAPKYTSTGYADTDKGRALKAHVTDLLKAIGPYPHTAIPFPVSPRGPASPILKVKLRCPDRKECGFVMTVNIGPSALEQGLPEILCPCGEPLLFPE
jgi:hypothetical protein